MRLVLHIGSTKTGSSALQSTLASRREALREAGILYSAYGSSAGAHHLLAAALHPGAWRMHAHELPDDRDGHFSATAAAIVKEAHACAAHTVVISSEYLWGSLPPSAYKTFAAAFRGIPIELVAFVRRQDEWATSSYMQAVKSGESREFAAWYAATLARMNSGLHYFRVINRWAYFLKATKTHVLSYARTKENVYGAFCEAVGLDVDKTMPPARVNPSPSREGVALLLNVNRSSLPEAQKAAERKRIMKRHVASGVTAAAMSEAEREALLESSSTSDALIVKHFLKGRGPLFPAPVRPAAPIVPADAA